MSKILVYGESYVAPRNHPKDSDWIHLLSKKLNMPVVNHAVDGASNEISITNLVNDIQQNRINDNDVVIFLVTTAGRLHLKQQLIRPDTGSKYIAEVDTSLLEHKWYKDNEDYVKWYLQNRDEWISNVNHICYVHFIRNFAETRPDVTVLVLMNDKFYVDMPIFKDKPKNFLMPNISLLKASEAEINDTHSRKYEEWVRYTMYDPRINHLSVPNLEILAELSSQAIKTQDASNFTQDKFLKNVFSGAIKNESEYKQYCEKGILTYSTEFFYPVHIKENVLPPSKKALIGRIIKFIKSIIFKIHKEYKYRKKLKELKNIDPFIYK